MCVEEFGTERVAVEVEELERELDALKASQREIQDAITYYLKLERTGRLRSSDRSEEE